MSWPSPFDVVLAAFRWLEYAGLIGFVGVVVVRRLAGLRPPLSWARASMRPSLVAALIGGVGVVILEAMPLWHPTGVGVVRVLAEADPESFDTDGSETDRTASPGGGSRSGWTWKAMLEAVRELTVRR